MYYIENKLNRSFPVHRTLQPMTLASDETWLDDRHPVTLSVGDLRHIIKQHEKAVSMIGDMALRCNCTPPAGETT